MGGKDSTTTGKGSPDKGELIVFPDLHPTVKLRRELLARLFEGQHSIDFNEMVKHSPDDSLCITVPDSHQGGYVPSFVSPEDVGHWRIRRGDLLLVNTVLKPEPDDTVIISSEAGGLFISRARTVTGSRFFIVGVVTRGIYKIGGER